MEPLIRLFEKFCSSKYYVVRCTIRSIDEETEQRNKLGSDTPGTMQEFLQHTSLKDSPGKNPAQKEMITELLKDLKSNKRSAS